MNRYTYRRWLDDEQRWDYILIIATSFKEMESLKQEPPSEYTLFTITKL